MRVFVTGGTGFIGEALVKALVAAKHSVTGLARSEKSASALEKLGATALRGGMSESKAWTSAAARHDALIQAAVEYSPESSALDRATIEAFLAAASEGIAKNVVYTSGVWVLGNCPGGVDETASVEAPFPSVAWRPSHERMILDANGSKLHTLVIRPGLVYGGHGSLTGSYFESATKEGTARIVGDGRNHVPLIHRDDLAQLYVRALEENASGVLHAVDGAALTVEELGRAASEAAGAHGKIQTVPLEEARKTLGGLAEALCLDQVVRGPRAAALGWKPKFASFTEGAKQAFSEWKIATAKA